MNIINPMKVDRIAYRCQCAICGTKVGVEKTDLHYAGGLELYWMCPICCHEQREKIFRLKSKEVVYYTEISKSK